MRSSEKLWRGLASVFAVLLALALFMTSLLYKWEGQVNVALGTTGTTSGATDSFYPTGYATKEDYLKDSDAHDIQTEAEGAVLVKNNGALPLNSSERSVTLFGRASADPVYRGNSGGAALDATRLVSLKSALENKGFKINTTLFNAYASSDVARVKVAVENGNGLRSSIGEVPVSFYSSELKASYENDYNDAAIIVFSRDGGEGRDLFYEDADGISQLALHQDEADLLKMIKASDKFSKVILLINSAYAMELGFVEQAEYGIDACLWIGGTGLKGFEGVAQLIVGEADPSGHFVDTYATNSLSSPAAQNAFNYTSFTNAGTYVVEAEGIYVGYKYYETRYYDCILNRFNANSTVGTFASDGNWNYAQEIAYPFGYGISYASFTQTLSSVVWDRNAHTVTAKVNVKNDGATGYSGKSKSTVQLYVQLPYEKGQSEKSAIQLIGFAKTKALAAGESDDVEITLSDYIFASYDENALNGADSNKKGCYVFDAGDYYFAIGNDCHDALNNVLAKQGKSGLYDHSGKNVSGKAANAQSIKLDKTDNVTYAKSQYTDTVVSNKLQDIDINYYYDDDPVTYLTRSDYNTFPKIFGGLTATDEMLNQMKDDTYEQPADSPDYSSVTTGAEPTLMLVDMHGLDFDDPKWETFLDQLTLSMMCSMVGENFGQAAIPEIGKQANTNSDGPAGPQGTGTTTRVNEVVAASTWNNDILYDRGKFIAIDCIYAGITQIWGPGCNIHRTPFSGRNFEYYSEDSMMSYLCSAVQTEAMAEYGCNAAPKHFVGNDQETCRENLCVYTTEQAFRQGPLKGFEGAFTEGGALATMMSFTRIGNRLTYTKSEVLIDILRKEWGFKGITITDSVANWNTSSPTIKSFASGTGTFNARAACGSELKKYVLSKKDGNLLSKLRESSHYFFYAMANSNNINGLEGENVVIKEITPWWKTALIAIDIVIGVLTLGAIVMYTLNATIFKNKRKEEKVL